jgi:hypothetical protein
MTHALRNKERELETTGNVIHRMENGVEIIERELHRTCRLTRGAEKEAPRLVVTNDRLKPILAKTRAEVFGLRGLLEAIR